MWNLTAGSFTNSVLFRSPAASVHFPDFLLCIISEKVKENDFPISLRQR